MSTVAGQFWWFHMQNILTMKMYIAQDFNTIFLIPSSLHFTDFVSRQANKPFIILLYIIETKKNKLWEEIWETFRDFKIKCHFDCSSYVSCSPPSLILYLKLIFNNIQARMIQSEFIQHHHLVDIFFISFTLVCDHFHIQSDDSFKLIS